MGPTATAIWMLMMFVLLLGLDLKQRPEYRCPSCGTSSAKEHGEECAWKAHYGDEF